MARSRSLWRTSRTSVTRKAAVQHNSFSRLQVDRHVVPLPQPFHQMHQPFHVVVGPGDVVAAAQVQPLHLGQIMAELFLEGFQRRLRSSEFCSQRVWKWRPSSRGKRSASKFSSVVPSGNRGRRGHRWRGLPGWNSGGLVRSPHAFSPRLWHWGRTSAADWDC